MLKRSVPIFAVRDVKATIAFYKDVLGFADHWCWGDPVTFGGANWGEVSVMFCQQPEVAANIEGHQHHYWSDELDALHDKHQGAGATIISPIENKPWGIREYTVRDPDGYHLRFSGPKKFEKPANALETLPGYIRIELRTPTDAEYRDLKKAVGWSQGETIAPPLSQNLVGVVAVDSRDGRAIGMLRVMQDADSWFSIWDVIVRPEYQSQRVGSSMLDTAKKRMRELIPQGGSIYLFTFSDKFYEKSGFANETCMKTRF